MKTLTFNRVHKNGWLSYKLPGVQGAVYVDKRMLSAESLATPPTSIEIDVTGMVEPGEGVSEASAKKAAAKLETETKKAEKAKVAAEKAQARLEKLQLAADKAKAAVAKAGGAESAPAAEAPVQ